MNQTIEALRGWRSYRKFYAKKGGDMQLNSYYQARLEEAQFNSFVVIGCIVAALVLIVIAAIH